MRDSFMDELTKYVNEVQQVDQELSFEEYLNKVKESPRLAQLAHARIYGMIKRDGWTEVEEDGNTLRHYNFFKNEVFGIEEILSYFVNHLHSAAKRLETRKRILLLVGPPGSGKSTLVTLLKRKLEEFSLSDDGTFYGIKNCPMREEPLHAIPHRFRENLKEEYALHVEGDLCPRCQLTLDEELHGDFTKFRVVRQRISEKRRQGVGVFQPSDPKTQDASDLVGSIDLSTIGEFGSESDPRAYRFDGEANVANRGMLEMVEMLKADERFLYLLLTLSQEQAIKAGRFPLIYADEFILAHSIAGDVPVPFRKNGFIRWATMQQLADTDDRDIEVIGLNLETKLPEWTRVSHFYRHPFTGTMVRTSQRGGVITTTDCHSLYNTDFECSYPTSQEDVLAIRQLPGWNTLRCVDLEFPDPITIDNGLARHPDVPGCQGNGNYRKNWMKAHFDLLADSAQLNDLLTVVAWYISEGHVNDAHAIISQSGIVELARVKACAESVANASASLQDRSDKADQTSRLHLSAKVWKLFLEHNCGRYSENKRIPNFVFSLPTEYQLHFFSELMKGDGTTKPYWSNVGTKSSSNYASNWFSYKTISQTLAAQVGFLASQLGYDYGIDDRYTSAGNLAYEISYRERTGNSANRIETFEVEGQEVFDIACAGNHTFMAGVGNVMCHNTNEAEFNSWKSDKKSEALRDRVIVHYVPYNLKVDDEVKIYRKLISETSVLKNLHIDPQVLKTSAFFAVLSRLEEPKKVGFDIIKKLKLYNGEEVAGAKDKDAKEMRQQALREGMDGIGPRFIINQLSSAIVKGEKGCLTTIDALRALKEGIDNAPSIKPEDKDRYKGFIQETRKNFDEEAKLEIQKAFVHSFEEQANNILMAYLDNVEAYCNKDKVRDPLTGEEMEPDTKLMKSIEEQIGVSDSTAKSFREEMLIRLSSFARRERKFEYSSHPRLKEAIEKKLFADLKDVVKITTNTKTPDKDQLSRLNEVAARLIEEQEYCSVCANELLQYIGTILNR